MNLEKNEGKIVDTIFEKKEYFSNKMLDNDNIEKVEFLSNLNIYIKGEKYIIFVMILILKKNMIMIMMMIMIMLEQLLKLMENFLFIIIT